MLLSDYKQLPRETRTAHINLSTPCEPSRPYETCLQRKSTFKTSKTSSDLTNDISDRRKGPHCLHHCEHDSSHGWCTNPLHISFGSASENTTHDTFGKSDLLLLKAAVAGHTAESRQKIVENTDYKLRAEKYRQTRGEKFVVVTPDNKTIEVVSQRGVAELIGCSRGTVVKALKTGHFGWKFPNWTVRRKE